MKDNDRKKIEEMVAGMQCPKMWQRKY